VITYIRAKLLIVDGRQAQLSQNLSAGSLEHNRELGTTVTIPEIAAQLTGDYAGT
jgi:hypothetical protein